jgi:hypothetical protein
LNARSIAIHREYLIALVRRSRGHENKTPTVVAEICFGILSTEGQLANMAQVDFARVSQWIIHRPMDDRAGTA